MKIQQRKQQRGKKMMRAIRMAKEKGLEVIEKMPKVRKIRQKMKGRLEVDW